MPWLQFMSVPAAPPDAGMRIPIRRWHIIVVALVPIVVFALAIGLSLWATTPSGRPANLNGLAPGHPAVMTMGNVTLTTLNATVTPCVTDTNGAVTGDIFFRFDYRITSAANVTVGLDVFLMIDGNSSVEHFYWINPGQTISDSISLNVGVYNSDNPSSTTCPPPPAAWLRLYAPLYSPQVVTNSRMAAP